jgi:hypothetical protein
MKSTQSGKDKMEPGDGGNVCKLQAISNSREPHLRENSEKKGFILEDGAPKFLLCISGTLSLHTLFSPHLSIVHTLKGPSLSIAGGILRWRVTHRRTVGGAFPYQLGHPPQSVGWSTSCSENGSGRPSYVRRFLPPLSYDSLSDCLFILSSLLWKSTRVSRIYSTSSPLSDEKPQKELAN